MSDADELMLAFWVARRKILLFLSLMLVIVTILGTMVYLVRHPRTASDQLSTWSTLLAVLQPPVSF